MTFKNTRIDCERSKEVEQWLEEEITEQQARYEKIVAEMEAMNEQREQWYAEFLERIQTHGFNEDGDRRVKIKPEDIPLRPEGPHKVVY